MKALKAHLKTHLCRTKRESNSFTPIYQPLTLPLSLQRIIIQFFLQAQRQPDHGFVTNVARRSNIDQQLCCIYKVHIQIQMSVHINVIFAEEGIAQKFRKL